MCRLVLVSFFVFISAVISFPTIGSEKTIIQLGLSDQDSSPYVVGHAEFLNNESPGILVDMLKIIENRVGVTFVFNRMPWTKSLTSLKVNDVDAVFSSSYKTERTAYGVYPMKDGKPDPKKAIRDNSYYFYTLKNSLVMWGGHFLINNRKPIGTLAGNAIINDVENLGYGCDLARSYSSQLENLRSHKVDVIVDIDFFIDNEINNNLVLNKGIVKMKPAFKRSSGYLMFSKKFYGENTKLVENIWTELGKLYDTKEFRTIIKSY